MERRHQRLGHLRAVLAICAAAVTVTAAQPAVAAPTTPAPTAVEAQARDLRAAWRPYDFRAISSGPACERRRTWLINNVGRIQRSNSRCQKFTVPQCPRPRVYWNVMVLTAGRHVEPLPLALHEQRC